MPVAPTESTETKFQKLDTSDLVGYAPVVSKDHSPVPTNQSVDLIVLSCNSRSAAEIAEILHRKRKNQQAIFWFDGNAYYKYSSGTMKSSSRPERTKAVYIHDLLNDGEAGPSLAAAFDGQPIIPVTPHLLDPRDLQTGTITISIKAPYTQLRLKTVAGEHFVPMLYLELLKVDLNWLTIDNSFTTFAEINATGSTPSSKPSEKPKSEKSARNTPTSEKPDGSSHSSAETMDNLYHSRPISAIMWPALLAFVLFAVVFPISLKKYHGLVRCPEEEQEPIMSAIKDLISVDHEASVQPFVPPKTVMGWARVYFVRFVARLRQMFLWVVGGRGNV